MFFPKMDDLGEWQLFLLSFAYERSHLEIKGIQIRPMFLHKFAHVSAEQ